MHSSKIHLLGAVLGCLTVIGCSASAATPAPDNHALAKTLCATFVEAQNVQSTALFDGIMTTGYIQHTPGIAQGLVGVKKAFDDEFTFVKKHHIPLHVTIEDVVVDGDRVVLRSLTKYKRNGKWYQGRDIDEWRIVDGRLGEHWDTDVKPQPSKP